MPENNREHIRLNLNCRVFVEPGATGAADLGGRDVALCETLDISYGGIKVSLELELTRGAIMPIGVEIPWLDQTLHLVGEVKWCRPADSRMLAWHAGFELLNAQDTDIAQWRELMTHV